MPKLLHELGCLLLGDECFYGGFARNEGNGIGDRMRIQEAVDGHRKLVKAGLILPCSIRDNLRFWDGGRNVVFPKVNCLGDHAAGGRPVKAAVELCCPKIQAKMTWIA